VREENDELELAMSRLSHDQKSVGRPCSSKLPTLWKTHDKHKELTWTLIN